MIRFLVSLNRYYREKVVKFPLITTTNTSNNTIMVSEHFATRCSLFRRQLSYFVKSEKITSICLSRHTLARTIATRLGRGNRPSGCLRHARKLVFVIAGKLKLRIYRAYFLCISRHRIYSKQGHLSFGMFFLYSAHP